MVFEVTDRRLRRAVGPRGGNNSPEIDVREPLPAERDKPSVSPTAPTPAPTSFFPPADTWNERLLVGPALPLALTLGLMALFLDIWLGGPLKTLDLWLARWSIDEASVLRFPASILDRIGLRGATVPLLAVLGLWLRWRSGRWRPLGLAILSVLTLNVVVGGLKLGVGRGRPSAADPELFVGDEMWPSGHAANIAMTTAILIYLLRTYGHLAISRKAAATTVMIPSVTMTTVSVALGYHWLTDLVAGTIVGLLIALGVTRLDARRFHPSSNGTSGNSSLPTPG